MNYCRSGQFLLLFRGVRCAVAWLPMPMILSAWLYILVMIATARVDAVFISIEAAVAACSYIRHRRTVCKLPISLIYCDTQWSSAHIWYSYQRLALHICSHNHFLIEGIGKCDRDMLIEGVFIMFNIYGMWVSLLFPGRSGAKVKNIVRGKKMSIQ